MIPPHALALILLWLCWENFFLLDIYLPIVFPLVITTASFHVTVSLFMTLLFTYFPHLILTPILHQNSLTLHYGSLLFSTLSRLVYLLLKTIHHHLLFPFTNLCCKVILNTMYLWIDKFVPQLSIIIIQFLNRNLFLPIIVLMSGLVYHLKMNLISFTFDHLNSLKSCHCFDYVIWWYRFSVS